MAHVRSLMKAGGSLEAWLSRLIAVPTERIELGLERVAAVHARLGSPRPAPLVVTVGGTNGKGSTVAFLSAMLRAAGYRVGCFTSPHLFRFNERIVVDGVAVDDARIVDAFQRVDAVRDGVALTFFEHATLAGLLVFAESALEIAVLEVGLGGRLDAVNLIDADVAVVTTVDLDHQQYLGDTREAIAVEKAGIFRPGRPAVIGEPEPPAALLAEAARIGAHPLRLGHEYRIDVDRDDWRWIGAGTSLRLPHPSLRAPVQHRNAAAAIATLMSLRDRLHVPFRALRIGLTAAQVRARLEVAPGDVERVIDVAHNPQAATALADWLRLHPRRTRAVFSALGDKDIAGIVDALSGSIAHWHLTGLDQQTPRGLAAAAIEAHFTDRRDVAFTTHASPEAALAAAHAAATSGDRVLVFGSFHLIAALEQVLNTEGVPAN
jgi:dihydrofolate synthase / folylpolyglutamate synthase